MSSAVPPARRLFILLTGLATAIAVLVAFGLPTHVPVPLDYTEYWAAGQLCFRGQNPYDPASVRAVQHDAGIEVDMAVMMWNPPWTLALVMPFGVLPIDVGAAIWMVAQLTAVLVSVDLLWRAFGAASEFRWVAWVLAIAFAPTTFVCGGGQITGFCLLGVAGFAAARSANRPGLAGVCAALTAIKPHLLALFGLALLLDAATRAGRRSLFGGVAAIAGTMLVALAANPRVLSQYLATLTAPSSPDHLGLADWRHPTIGWLLRHLVAPQSFAVQFLPLAVGVVVVLVAWRRSGFVWDWPRALPWLVLGSMLAAPYGAWSFDIVLLLVPIVAAAAALTIDARVRSWFPAAVVFAVLTLVLFAVFSRVPKMPEEYHVWVTPTVSAGCLAIAAFGRRPAKEAST